MGKFTVIIADQAKADLLKLHKSGDRPSIRKVEMIINELYEHPETGLGKPEKLRFGFKGYWSRRINKKDRLIYTINNLVISVTIISASSHYGDK